MRRSLTNVSTVMNLLLIYISWIGWNGVTRLNPYKISLHGTFTMTIVVIFVLYLILITATGGADNEGPLLLLVFCTVSIDAFVGFQTLRFGFVLSRFETLLASQPELLSTTPFRPGSNSAPSQSQSQSLFPKTTTRNAKKSEERRKELQRALAKKIEKLQELNETKDAPAAFICPVSLCLMSAPTICDDGNTYDYESIKGWFDRGKKTSPVTNMPVKDRKCLIPNMALRGQIEEWVGKKLLDVEFDEI